MLGAGAGGGAETVTVTDWLAVPPVPLHVRVKVVFDVSAPLDVLPEVVFPPDQPPEAVQLSTLFVLQFSVVAALVLTEDGLALSETVGVCTGGAPTLMETERVTWPPSPLQVSV